MKCFKDPPTGKYGQVESIWERPTVEPSDFCSHWEPVREEVKGLPNCGECIYGVDMDGEK